jgi:hypothetical protein
VRKTILGLFMLAMLASAMNAQPKPAPGKSVPKQSVSEKQTQTLITRLKTTPVADIETGLPTDPFGKWFPRQVGSSQIQYDAKPCEAEASITNKGQRDPLMCVTASAKIGEMRKLELTFAMEGYSGGKQAKSTAARKPRCRFLVGSLGPSDPRAKFPTRVVNKLADLPPILNR